MWWVSLAALPADTAIDAAVTAAFTVTGQSGYRPASVEDALTGAIGRGNGLLVLDNCEHVVDACAGLATRLLAACPRLRVLATSREALRIPGEALFPLRPLATSGPAAAGPLLFADRARKVLPEFGVDRTVERLCAALDGLPLAIELAARQMNHYTPAQLLDGLDDRLTVLAGDQRGAPAHHRSLRTAIEWSYDLLGDDERAAFRRLAAPPGGFDERTAAALCADILDTDGVWSVLLALAAKSMVIPDEASPGRFRILDSLRAFGRDLLAADGELDATEARLTAWFTDRTRGFIADAGIVPPDVIALLEGEHQNLLYAVTLTRRAGDERCLQLAAAIAMYWQWFGGDMSSAQTLLEQVLDEHPGPSPGRALALRGLALVLCLRGEHARARPLAEAAVDLARRLDQKPLTTRALMPLILAVLELGDDERAIVLSRERVRMLRGFGDVRVLRLGLEQLAWTLALTGQLAAAEEALDELAVHRERGDAGRSTGVNTAGVAAFLRARFEQATAAFRMALTLPAAGDTSYVDVYNVEGLGLVAAEKGDHRRARRLLAAASAWRAASGHRAERAWRRLLDRAAASVGPAEEDEVLALAEAVAYALDNRWPGDAARPDGLLTAREEQVAELVAQGRTNPQIAAQLGIAPRTARHTSSTFAPSSVSRAERRSPPGSSAGSPVSR